jgi:hypothetical protein
MFMASSCLAELTLLLLFQKAIGIISFSKIELFFLKKEPKTLALRGFD